MFDQVIRAGEPVPEFKLARVQGGPFTQAELVKTTTVLYFYPFAFSPVCTHQLGEYNAVLGEFDNRGVKVYGVSCDSTFAVHAFREQLGLNFELLSDFFPQGAACDAFRVPHLMGFPERALVLVGPDGVVRWSFQVPSSSDPAPGAKVLFEVLKDLQL